MALGCRHWKWGDREVSEERRVRKGGRVLIKTLGASARVQRFSSPFRERRLTSFLTGGTIPRSDLERRYKEARCCFLPGRPKWFRGSGMNDWCLIKAR
jgi:hypothetical protein